VACVTLLCTYIIYGIPSREGVQVRRGHKNAAFLVLVREKLIFFSQNVCRYEKSNYLWGEFKCVWLVGCHLSLVFE
jgi:hypothetical protein